MARPNLNMLTDKKSKFADLAIPAMKIDSVLHQSERRLKPLIMELCNGGYPCHWSFTIPSLNIVNKN